MDDLGKYHTFNKNVIHFGDRVVIDLGKFKNLAVILEKDQVSQTRFGALKHNDCVGKRYGSKFQTSKGYVHILAMNPVLWSETLFHRTQIIYPTDASLIVGELELRPGKYVFESGTGSGSLTHFLIQAILPNGFVNTFDFHEDRMQYADREFKTHALDPFVRANHRDVCTDYFPPVGDKLNPHGVDAIILDLPRPWTVIPHLHTSFNSKSGGRVCIFSPCIEQIQRSCIALTNAGFIHLNTMECLEREYDMVRVPHEKPNLGQLEALIGDEHEEELSILTCSPKKIHSSNNSLKRKHDSLAEQSGFGNNDVEELIDNEHYSDTESGNDEKSDIKKPSLTNKKNPTGFDWQPILKYSTNGHTGYLTFATWPARTKSVEPDALKSSVDQDGVLAT